MTSNWPAKWIIWQLASYYVHTHLSGVTHILISPLSALHPRILLSKCVTPSQACSNLCLHQEVTVAMYHDITRKMVLSLSKISGSGPFTE
jgi:hypothetical protein